MDCEIPETITLTIDADDGWGTYGSLIGVPITLIRERPVAGAGIVSWVG